VSPRAARAAWTLQTNGYGQEQGYFQVSAFDDRHAMAVGTHDKGDGTSEGVVAITSDGATWSTQQPGGAMSFYTSVAMTGPGQAFVGSFGKIFVTSDGGAGWAPYAEGGWGPMRGPVIAGFSFVDANTGFLVGSAGTMRATGDGGATWTPLDGPVAGADFGGVRAVDADHVWVWGGASTTDPDTGEVTGYEGGLLGCSTDGGATWTVVFQDEARAVGRVFMLNAREGWMISISMDGPRLEKTSDGGATWSDMAIPAGAGGAPDYLMDVFFFDRCEGFLLGEAAENTQLQYTRDRGSSWSQVDLSGIRLDLPFPFPVPLRLAAFDFPSREVGFAGGFHEALVKYLSDGPGPGCGGGADGGSSGGDDDESGCSCRTTGSAGGGCLAMAAIVAALLLCRRRRTS
jgi:photosystem II stability/assembly factor-like uncharacterized protein